MRLGTVLVVAVTLATLPSFSPLASSAEIAIPANNQDWLAEVNYYRLSSDLPPVTEDLKITDGAKKHVRYLAMSEKKYFVGQYVNRHSENPASPYSTPEGTEYGAGDIAWNSEPGKSFIDMWMTAPFHAIGILREQLQTVGYASELTGPDSIDPNYYLANLAVIKGFNYLVPRSKNILFPGDNSIIHLNRFTGENPEPRESCSGDYQNFVGLPIFASLLVAPTRDLTATLTAPDGTEISAKDQLCVVDEHNFSTTDNIYGPAGKSIIESDHLVLIIPKQPLTAGKYKVSIKQNGRSDIDWSFKYVDSPKIESLTQDADLAGFTWKNPQNSDANPVLSYLFQVKSGSGDVVKEINTTDTSLKLVSLGLSDAFNKYTYCVKPIYMQPIPALFTCSGAKVLTVPKITTNYPLRQTSLVVGQSATIRIQDYFKRLTASDWNTQVCTVSWSNKLTTTVIVTGIKAGVCKIKILGSGYQYTAAIDQVISITVTGKVSTPKKKR